MTEDISLPPPPRLPSDLKLTRRIRAVETDPLEEALAFDALGWMSVETDKGWIHVSVGMCQSVEAQELEAIASAKAHGYTPTGYTLPGRIYFRDGEIYRL